MKKTIAILALTACSASAALAQSGSDALVKGAKAIDGMVRSNVLKAAEEMPEENYSFKPVDSVRTFGAVVAHVADGQYEMCGPVVGDGAKAPDFEKTKTSKADIIAALKQSNAYCDKAYAGLTDQSAAMPVDFFGRKTPKLNVLGLNTAHNDEHYGNMVTYMRMKGLVPPSSK